LLLSWKGSGAYLVDSDDADDDDDDDDEIKLFAWWILF
jgi:hypothetical protein